MSVWVENVSRPATHSQLSFNKLNDNNMPYVYIPRKSVCYIFLFNYKVIGFIKYIMIFLNFGWM